MVTNTFLYLVSKSFFVFFFVWFISKSMVNIFYLLKNFLRHRFRALIDIVLWLISVVHFKVKNCFTTENRILQCKFKKWKTNENGEEIYRLFSYRNSMIFNKVMAVFCRNCWKFLTKNKAKFFFLKTICIAYLRYPVKTIEFITL